MFSYLNSRAKRASLSLAVSRIPLAVFSRAKRFPLATCLLPLASLFSLTVSRIPLAVFSRAKRLPLATCLLPLALTSAPKISVDQPLLHFAKMDESQTFKGFYTIKNTGDELLKIGKITSCCGSKSSIDKKELKPGETTKLHIELKLKGRVGPQDKNVFISSNDSTNAYLNLKLKGEVVKTYTLSKRFLNWKKLSQSRSHQKELTFKWAYPDKYKVTSVTTDLIGLKVDLNQAKDLSYKLSLVTNSDLKEGRQRFKVFIETNHPDYKKITVYGNALVESDYIVQPKLLKIKKSGIKENKLTRYFTVKAKGSKKLAPKLLNPENIKE